nr:YbdK family carboxylate-amine ligase [Gemmatimonadota bacterium]NIQ53880.1 YbdK family carboxylate-amine ligase [Gemmatimonadota bacterium]NIU74049.1 YbdK family carboxylate-amine ligase [Gammaproteobacteria bacterium]NIX44109.1 YbdK family carboxylate-amine ligase [Gemmatimonadota bacterium]NIY08343.1 YbdK family carboxylate-amine ligase [Gemmatimonadota bacterium]
FSGWEGHGIHQGERYASIAARHDRVARAVQIFGMHIHVGLPERVDRLPVMEQVRAVTPHLLALSASSPFLDAEDTGFASYRAVLWRQYPYTGIPPRFDSEEAYAEFLGLLLRSQALQDKGSLYWSVRPHSTYRTLEFRSPDACPNMADAVTVAALARLIVVGVAEAGIPVPGPGPLTPDAWRAVLVENEWHAARYGLDAVLTDPESPSGRSQVRARLRALLDDLAPVAEELGEIDVLERAEALMERGNGAERMRQVYRDHGSYAEVVAWLIRETRLGTGFDRRKTQRASGA